MTHEFGLPHTAFFLFHTHFGYAHAGMWLVNLFKEFYIDMGLDLLLMSCMLPNLEGTLL